MRLRFIAGGISIFFLLTLLFLLFRIWSESRCERSSPGKIAGETLSKELTEAALRPLRELSRYYEKRDTGLIDKCIDEIMLPERLLILGTNPKEIFFGRDGATRLLLGDWKYWGQAAIDADRAALYQIGNAVYFVVRGQVKLDIWRFMVPIKITGILEEHGGSWYISKMQFTNELNTNYVFFAWGASIALIVSLLVFALTFLPLI